MKRPAVIAGAVLVLVVSLLGGLWIFGNTAPGRASIERLTDRLTAGQVRLAGLGGDFPLRLTLAHLELRDDLGVWLSADNIAVRWSPLALLARRIQVDDLQASRVHMERTPVSGGGGASVSVPHVEVGHFRLNVVELGAPLVGRPTTLTAAGGMQMRSLEDASGEVVVRRQDGDGEYRLNLRLDPQRMNISLKVHEPASGPLENLLSLPGLGALDAAATLAGPRSAERIDVVMTAGDLHGEVHGGVDLSHASAELDFSLRASAMAPRAEIAWDDLALDGGWHGSLSAPALKGTLQVDGLRIAGQTRIRRLRADLRGSAGRVSMQSVLEGLEIPGPQPGLFADDPLKVDASMLLNQPTRPLELSASHRLFDLRARGATAMPASGGRHGSLELRLPEVQPFASLAGQDVRGAAIIAVQLVDTSADDAVSLDATLNSAGGTASWLKFAGARPTLKVEGVLAADSIKVRSLRVEADRATFTANGSAARIQGAATPAAAIKDLQVRWQLEAPDLGRLSDDLAGDLKASGQLSGSPMSLVVDADVSSHLSVRGSESGMLTARVHVVGLPAAPGGTLQAQGTVDGAPLALDAALDRGAGDEVRMVVRKADWKSAHADGDATWNKSLSDSRGQLRLHVLDLADFDRILGTHVSGALEGTLAFLPGSGQPELKLDLSGRSLAIQNIAGDIRVQAAGPADAVSIQLTAQLSRLYDAPASVSAAATLDMVSRELRISGISADYRHVPLHLMAPALLSFAHGASIDDVKLGADGAVFEVGGQFAPALDLRASVTHVGPGLVNAFSPDLLATGTIEGLAQLQGSPSSPTGQVDLKVTGLQFADDAAAGLPPLDMNGRAQLADGAASIDARLSAGAGSQLQASGKVPFDGDAELNVKVGGKLDLALVNPVLEARGLRATGELDVDATVTGTTNAPTVGGGITLGGGSLRDYAHGVNLSNMQAQIDGVDGGLRIKTFTAKAASGTLGMTGTVGVLQHGIPVDLRITAEKAQPIASSILTAVLDADITVKGTALQRLDVDGTIRVERATIGIPNTLPPDVAVLDVRRRGRHVAAAAAGRLVIGLNLDIEAPQQILVKGRGLDAELGGDLQISGTTADPQVGGGFDLQRGNFTIAGNTLVLTPPGRVGFDGAGLRKKIDPTLDFTATSTVSSPSVSNATVTLKISGNADAPRFDFTSTPTLPPDEIMALLLFGESASQLTALQAAQIGAALATLSGVGGGDSNPIVKLQKSLGLDRLTVGANTTTTATGATENSGAAIAAGRYVTKRVYIEGKQTTTGTSQVQVDVELTKHLKLQTRLGNGTATVQGTTPENDPGSSIGLSYQFEY